MEMIYRKVRQWCGAFRTGRGSAVVVEDAYPSYAIAFRRFGMTLVGFLRGDRLNVYAGAERIALES